MGIFNYTIHQLQEQNFDFGLKNYPIFDESHREELNRKLLNEYLMEEIGQETPTLFKVYLNRAMEKIMPFYNELYKTAKLDFDIANEYSFTDNETSEMVRSDEERGSSDVSNTNTQRSSADSFSILSKPPQTRASIGDMKNGVYGRESNYVESNGDSTTTDKGNTTSTNTKTGNDRGTRQNVRKGRGKSVALLVEEYRRSILNIDRMIIEDEEIQKLFYGIYY